MNYGEVRIEFPSTCIELQALLLEGGYYVDIPTAQRLIRDFDEDSWNTDWMSDGFGRAVLAAILKIRQG